MPGSATIVRELVAKFDVLAAEDISLAGQVALHQCRNLCLRLSNEAAPSLESRPNTLVPIRERQRAIMLVDDDEDTLRVLEFVLRREGFIVHSVANALDVIGELDKLRPDIVLMDLVMPQMSCLELLPQIKSHPVHRQTKVIVGSSRTFDRDRLAVLRLGASDFVPKPFHIEELVLRLHNLAG